MLTFLSRSSATNRSFPGCLRVVDDLGAAGRGGRAAQVVRVASPRPVSRWMASGDTRRKVCPSASRPLGGHQPVRRVVPCRSGGEVRVGTQVRSSGCRSRTTSVVNDLGWRAWRDRSSTTGRLRISDADRHRVAEILRVRSRAKAAWDRRSRPAARGDVRRADLRRPGPDHPRPAAGSLYPRRANRRAWRSGPDVERHVAILGGLDRKGGWWCRQPRSRDDGRRRPRPAGGEVRSAGGHDHHQLLHGWCADHRPAPRTW